MRVKDAQQITYRCQESRSASKDPEAADVIQYVRGAREREKSLVIECAVAGRLRPCALAGPSGRRGGADKGWTSRQGIGSRTSSPEPQSIARNGVARAMVELLGSRRASSRDGPTVSRARGSASRSKRRRNAGNVLYAPEGAVQLRTLCCARRQRRCSPKTLELSAFTATVAQWPHNLQRLTAQTCKPPPNARVQQAACSRTQNRFDAGATVTRATTDTTARKRGQQQRRSRVKSKHVRWLFTPQKPLHEFTASVIVASELRDLAARTPLLPMQHWCSAVTLRAATPHKDTSTPKSTSHIGPLYDKPSLQAPRPAASHCPLDISHTH